MIKMEQTKQKPTDKYLKRTSTIEEWEKDKDGKWRIRKTTYNKIFHPTLRKWVPESEEVVFVSPAERGYLKTIEAHIIVIRKSLDAMLNPVQIYILRTFKGEIPDAKPYKTKHLKISEPNYYKGKFNHGNVLLCDFDGMSSQSITLNDGEYFTKVKDTLISTEVAQDLLKEAKVLGAFEESHTGELTVCASFVKI